MLNILSQFVCWGAQRLNRGEERKEEDRKEEDSWDILLYSINIWGREGGDSVNKHGSIGLNQENSQLLKEVSG